MRPVLRILPFISSILSILFYFIFLYLFCKILNSYFLFFSFWNGGGVFPLSGQNNASSSKGPTGSPPVHSKPQFLLHPLFCQEECMCKLKQCMCGGQCVKKNFYNSVSMKKNYLLHKFDIKKINIFIGEKNIHSFLVMFKHSNGNKSHTQKKTKFFFWTTLYIFTKQ